MRKVFFVALSVVSVCLAVQAVFTLPAYGQEVVGWGDNEYGQATPPDGNDFVAVAAGYDHSLALRSDGSIVGWGNNWDGWGNWLGQATPPAGNDFIAIAAGGQYSLALKSDGSLFHWGSSVWDLLTPPPAGNNFVAIAAGDSHCLALKSDGSIVGWGGNWDGQAKPPIGNNFVAVAAGYDQSFVIKSNGSIAGWGENGQRQATPPAGNDFIAVAAGDWHSLALKSDGSLIGWGGNNSGQATPPAGNDFIAIAAGASHSLALKSDCSIVGWGGNWDGRATPPAGNHFTAVSAGYYHSLALKSDIRSATGPFPVDAAYDVSADTELDWMSGQGATSHNIYFGTANPPPFICTQTAEVYAPGTLADGTTYYWRIDENNPGGVVTGTIWYFTTLSRPDIAVVSASVDKTVVAVGEAVTVTVVCKNQGCATTSKTSYVGYFSDRATAPAVSDWSTKAGFDLVETLMPGISGAADTLSISYTTVGIKNIWVLADGSALVAEGNETNNAYGPIVVTVKSADLIVNSASLSKATIGVGETVTLTAFVKNAGEGKVLTTSLLAFYSDLASAPTYTTATSKTVSTVALAAGATGTALKFSFSYTEPGSKKVWLLADQKKAVSESDESNNGFGPLAVTVKASDLVIESASVDKTHAAIGETVTLSVVVKNAGDWSTLKASTLAYYKNLASSPTTQASSGTKSVPILTAGSSSAVLKFTFSYTAAGTNKIWVLADKTKAVPEYNETNNTFGPITVTVP